MNHCVRHISAAINRSASRNIFLKATKMVNLARQIVINTLSGQFGHCVVHLCCEDAACGLFSECLFEKLVCDVRGYTRPIEGLVE